MVRVATLISSISHERDGDVTDAALIPIGVVRVCFNLSSSGISIMGNKHLSKF